MSKVFLGVDTSNYTTSVSLCVDGEIVSNIKVPIPVESGERGVRQSEALFSHVKSLPVAFEKLGKVRPDAIGVSERPRDIEGSYMPCFLAGVSVATSMASLLGVPLYRFSHQRGHIRAAVYSSKMPGYEKFIAFHVSGGTTEMLLVDGDNIELIGKSLDINAGQLIDRVGVMLGMGFPCGRELESVADYNGVELKTCVRGLDCNLSGLENMAARMHKDGRDISKIAGFTILNVERTLDKMTANALKKYGDLPLLYAGGVMSNRRIKESFTKKYGAYFAEPQFSADNAAGCALLCMDSYNKQYK